MFVLCLNQRKIPYRLQQTMVHTQACTTLHTQIHWEVVLTVFSKSYLIGWLFDKLVLNGMQNENINNYVKMNGDGGKRRHQENIW